MEEGKVINDGIQLIEVDKVLKAKAGRFSAFIPGLLVRYLKRIVHQDEMNKALLEIGDIKGLEFVKAVLIDRFGLEIEVVNPENIPVGGRYIVAANHPLGGFDGMALMHVIGQVRQDMRFLSNDILMELKALNDLFVPINKHGRNRADVVRILESYLAGDQMLMIFPAGLVSRRQGKIIRDLEWKKTFITKAVQHKRDVVPVYIEGRNSNFFYNLARWRKRLRIGFNIEMLYLPDEMFRQKNKKLRIVFGKPVPYITFTKKHSHKAWAQIVKDFVYGLPQGKTNFEEAVQQ